MKAVFIGVGEAFDDENHNTSILIELDTRLLLDCGYSAAREVWKYRPEADFIDAIFISHTHADHYFGIPPLLLRLFDAKREKKLTIICLKGNKEKIEQVIELGYKGLMDKKLFEIEYIEVLPGQDVKLNELELDFESTTHTAANLAIRVSDGEKSLCYSGDGNFTEKSEILYEDCNLLIHESFLLKKSLSGHGNMHDVIQLAERCKVGCLALTHIQRYIRANEMELIKHESSKSKIKVAVPEAGEIYSI